MNKKLLSILTLLVVGVTGAWANYSSSTVGKTTTLTWDFAEYTEKVQIATGETETYEGIVFYGGGGSNKEEIATSGFKLQGTSQQWNKVWGRYFKYTPSQDGTMTVYVKGNGSSSGRCVFLTTTLQKLDAVPASASGSILGVSMDLGDGSTSKTDNFSVELTSGTTYYVEGFGGVTITKVVYTYTEAGNPPTIGTQPAGATYTRGDVATALSVAATPYADGALSYQWYSNTINNRTSGTVIDGATSSSFTPSTETAGTLYYYCKVTESGNEDVATSNTAAIVVNNPSCAAPTFTLGSYNYTEAGYSVIPACETPDATLTYKIGDGPVTACVAGTPFYAKGGKLIITASKEGYASNTNTSTTQYTLNSAPSSTSPEILKPFNTSSDDGDKNKTHTYKSVTIDGGVFAGIENANANGVKIRTNQNSNTLTLSVNSGYKVTGVSISAKSNNKEAAISVSGISVDGEALVGFSTVSFPINTSDATTCNTGTINALSSIVFTFDNSEITGVTNKKNYQILATITVSYEILTVSGTISASGFNTFSSTQKLDLSTISGGSAYVASSVTDGKVVLTKVDDKVVAAGTGLIIAGTAGDPFTINVTSADATFAGTNLLEGVTAAQTISKVDDGYNRYVFGWSDPANPSFYLVNGTAANLSAGKAYLKTTGTLNVAGSRLALSFGDDATGINSMNSEERIVNSEVYDLQGRRVAVPQKGLYIVNSKKVIIK